MGGKGKSVGGNAEGYEMVDEERAEEWEVEGNDVTGRGGLAERGHPLLSSSPTPPHLELLRADGTYISLLLV